MYKCVRDFNKDTIDNFNLKELCGNEEYFENQLKFT